MYLIVPQFRAFSPSLPPPRISDKQILFLFIPKATCGRTDRQTDRQYVSSKTFRRHRNCISLHTVLVAIHPKYLLLLLFLIFIGFGRWRGFLSLVGDFEMWCLQEISIRTTKVSRIMWRSAFSFGVFVEWGARARALSLSVCGQRLVCISEINQTRDSCSPCSCSGLAICSTPR